MSVRFSVPKYARRLVFSFCCGVVASGSSSAGTAETSQPTGESGNVVVAAKSTKTRVASSNMLKHGLGFVYTLDNDIERNGLVVFRRDKEGALVPLIGSPFHTGGRGLSGGDIDEQGAVRVTERFVLAVNPGSDSIAVFEKTERGLLHVEGSPFPSGGSTPLSIAIHGSMVFVANQAATFANPKSEPNVAGFTLTDGGQLIPLNVQKTIWPAGMGPAQVEFTPDGTTLLVTSGFQSENSSRIHAFRIAADGTLTPRPGSPVTPEGASGTVGFSVSPDGRHIFASTFRNSGVVLLELDQSDGAIRQVGSLVPNDQRAACWTTLAKDGRTLYVGNFVSNSISVYDISADGRLTLLGSIPRRGATNKDTKDIVLSHDGKYLYAIGSQERQISIFRVEPNRLLTELSLEQSPLVVPTGQNTTGLAAD